MREIKFRAWDEKHKEMIYIRGFYWFEEEGVDNSDGQGYYIKYILLQYTGLKDKNGKEIYEGDVLQYTDNYNRPITGQVQYLGNGFWIEEKDKTHYMPNDREVIGNIYENPELVGGTQKEAK